MGERYISLSNFISSDSCTGQQNKMNCLNQAKPAKQRLIFYLAWEEREKKKKFHVTINMNISDKPIMTILIKI